MPRIPLIAGNWKMFKTIPETLDFCNRLKAEIGAFQGKKVESAVAPPFTAIAAAVQALQGSPILVASQDVDVGRQPHLHFRREAGEDPVVVRRVSVEDPLAASRHH